MAGMSTGRPLRNTNTRSVELQPKYQPIDQNSLREEKKGNLRVTSLNSGLRKAIFRNEDIILNMNFRLRLFFQRKKSARTQGKGKDKNHKTHGCVLQMAKLLGYFRSK